MTRAPALLTALALAGCAGSAATEGAGAHVLFLVRPGCPTVVARTLAVAPARAFTVLTLDEPAFAPRAGDVLEGPARTGRSVFVYYRDASLADRADGVSVAADVLSVGLDPAKAREYLDAECGDGGRGMEDEG